MRPTRKAEHRGSAMGITVFLVANPSASQHDALNAKDPYSTKARLRRPLRKNYIREYKYAKHHPNIHST